MEEHAYIRRRGASTLQLLHHLLPLQNLLLLLMLCLLLLLNVLHIRGLCLSLRLRG